MSRLTDTSTGGKHAEIPERAKRRHQYDNDYSASSSSVPKVADPATEGTTAERYSRRPDEGGRDGAVGDVGDGDGNLIKHNNNTTHLKQHPWRNHDDNNTMPYKLL